MPIYSQVGSHSLHIAMKTCDLTQVCIFARCIWITSFSTLLIYANLFPVSDWYYFFFLLWVDTVRHWCTSTRRTRKKNGEYYQRLVIQLRQSDADKSRDCHLHTCKAYFNGTIPTRFYVNECASSSPPPPPPHWVHIWDFKGGISRVDCTNQMAMESHVLGSHRFAYVQWLRASIWFQVKQTTTKESQEIPKKKKINPRFNLLFRNVCQLSTVASLAFDFFIKKKKKCGASGRRRRRRRRRRREKMVDAKMRDANNQVRETSAKMGNKLSKWRPVALGQGRGREIPP